MISFTFGYLISLTLMFYSSGIAPPTEYVHPYDGTVIEDVLIDQQLVQQKCVALGAPHKKDNWLLGCQYFEPRKMVTFWQNKTCHIIRIPVPIVHDHELAHCNGWHHE